MNKQGISVIFEDSKATAIRNGNVVFTASCRNGQLFKIDTEADTAINMATTSALSGYGGSTEDNISLRGAILYKGNDWNYHP